MLTVTGISRHLIPRPAPLPTRTWPRRRVTQLLVGTALLVCSIGITWAGAFALMAKAGATQLGLGAHGTYRTDRSALVTDSTDWGTEWFGWAGSVRLEARSTGNKPILVGVAKPAVIHHYFADTSYTLIGERSGGVVRIEHGGAARPPIKTIVWTAHAQGTGPQSVSWSAADGPQIVVAMNADGSAPVGVRVVSSAVTLDRMPWSIPAGLLGIGMIVLATAVMVLRRAVANRNRVAARYSRTE